MSNRIDSYGLARADLDDGHWLAHAKKLFSNILLNANVAATTTVDTTIVVPAGLEMHVLIGAEANQGMQTLTLLKDVTGTSGGSAVGSVNHSQLGTPKTTTVVVTKGVSGLTGGTLLFTKHIYGASNGPFQNASSIRSSAEWILPAGTHALRLVTGASAANYVDIALEFYEVTS